MAAADLVIVTSGTATLETAILERPMVIVYRTPPFTAYVGQRLMRVPFIGMPNLIAGREIVPELLQGKATPERVVRESLAILDDPARSARMVEDLAEVRRRLGSAGADERAAASAAALLEAGPGA
jgi:lipid-A-disaccharide synthase